ncbi:putative mitochondrial protein [Cardamine amara subsp. amara]|uniref:Mitochondrial protein n=1 Tax=Cardamine amara subsp. amara TaxID=228776 RepID=A0ABD1BGS4_CARAN
MTYDIFEEKESLSDTKLHQEVVINIEEQMTNQVPEVISKKQASHVSETTSKRKSKPPGHLQDYYCNAISDVTKDVSYPISTYINYAKLSEEFTAYICAVNKYPKPCTYAQAKKIKEWLDAMEIEIYALKETNTWTVCSLPAGKEPIGCKWMFKVILNADGSLEWFKA